MRRVRRLRLGSAAALAALCFSACASPGIKEGALVGSGYGALIGALASGAPGAAVGAAAGLLFGGVLGVRLGDPEATGPDRDGDRVSDQQDNCPDQPNRDQQDSNGDGRGDACSP